MHVTALEQEQVANKQLQIANKQLDGKWKNSLVEVSTHKKSRQDLEQDITKLKKKIQGMTQMAAGVHIELRRVKMQTMVTET